MLVVCAQLHIHRAQPQFTILQSFRAYVGCRMLGRLLMGWSSRVSLLFLLLARFPNPPRGYYQYAHI